MASKKTVPVTRRALVQRINRALSSAGEQLRISRGAQAVSNLGEYYILDMNRNAVIAQHCDLEELGRELKVLEPFESLAADK